MKRFLIISGIVVGVIIVYFIFFRKTEIRTVTAERVRSVEASLGEIQVKLEETGDVQPIRRIDIKSRISGEVIKFFVSEGDFVNRGDLIAEIEPDFNQANQIANIRNNVRINEIRKVNAQKEYERKQQLYDKNFISKDEMDKAVDDLEISTINYHAAVQQYELVRDIDTDGNVSRIYASASGTVIEIVVEEGEMVVSSTSSYSDGTVILKLADLSQMLVNTAVNEIDISKIHLQQRALIRIDAFPYDSFEGQISKISPSAITRNNVKVFQVEVLLDQSDTRLMPGMTANVTIIGESKKDIVVIPINTIFSDQDGQDIVYKVVSDTVAASVPIKTGINDFNMVEIIEGISEGDRVSLTEPRRLPSAGFRRPGF